MRASRFDAAAIAAASRRTETRRARHSATRDSTIPSDRARREKDDARARAATRRAVGAGEGRGRRRDAASKKSGHLRERRDAKNDEKTTRTARKERREKNEWLREWLRYVLTCRFEWTFGVFEVRARARVRLGRVDVPWCRREGTFGVFEVRVRSRISGFRSLRHGAERSLYTRRRQATRRRSRAHVSSSERWRHLHARIPAGMERARRALSRGALESCSRASTDVMITARRAVYALISHRGESALMATPTSTDARMTSPRRSPLTRSSCHSNIAATLSKHPMTYWSMRK